MLSRGNFLSEPYLTEKESNYKFKQYWSLDYNERKVVGKWHLKCKIVYTLMFFRQ